MDTFEFGPFRLDVAEHVLSETGRAIPLKPKVFETLVLLVRNSGHLMTKQDLMSALWPETVVDETNLTKNIWLIRRALGEGEDSAAYIETVPRVGYRFVGAIRRVEADAPEPAREAAPVAIAAEAPAPRPPPRSHGRVWTVLGAAFLLAIAGGLWLGWRTHRSSGLSTGPQRSIAVLGFRNLSGRADLDWMATALREMLQAELSSASSYRVLAAESAERIRRELALVSTASLSPESLGSVRRRAPVDEIVGGSYLLTDPGQGSQIRIDVVVQDAKTGETLHALTETGDAARLLEVVSSVGSRLRLALRERALSPADSGRARATLPQKQATLLLYTRGLEKLRASEALAARDLLAQAVGEEPEFPLSHAALGRAFGALGYDEKSRLELQQAFALSDRLPRRERLGVEAEFRTATKEWAKAIEIYEEVFRSAPDDLDSGLELARTEHNAGRWRDALRDVEALHRLPHPAGNDPRIDLIESTAAFRVNDWKRSLAGAERALAESRARDERLVAADALQNRCNALHALGRKAEARGSADEALRIFVAAQDLGGEARTIKRIGDLQFDEGDMPGAERSYRRSLELDERIGNVRATAADQANVARVVWELGDLKEAERLVSEAISVWRAIPDRRNLAWGLNATGVIRADQGDLARAIELHREAIAISRELKDEGSYLQNGLSFLGNALWESGRLAEAEPVFREGLEIARRTSDPGGVADYLQRLGGVALERDSLNEADQDLAEALALQKKNANDFAIPEVLIDVARLRIEQGKAEEGLRLAQQAAERLAASKRPPQQALAESFAVRALVVLGRAAEAAAVAERARGLLTEKTPAQIVVPVLIASSLAAAASERNEEARSYLRAADERARRMGWVNLILEDRLAEAELDSHDGAKTALLEHTASLVTDSHRAGFERIARHAERLGHGSKA